ncbi:hypothetical protein BGZ83_001168 [Gryganskiella cystojenkinii]|nr:hypothetical protein BGZ83_001168 [Gryganskiella cystojenkinii]
MVLCATSLLVLQVQAQRQSHVVGDPNAALPDAPLSTSTGGVLPTTPASTTVPVATTTSSTTIAQQTTITLPHTTVTSVVTTAPPRVSSTTSSPPPLPSANTTCTSSSTCGQNQLCALPPNAQAGMGICQPFAPNQQLCVPPQNPQPCQSSADCNTAAYSYCGKDPTSNTNVCTGLGVPGTSSACGANNSSGPSDNKSDSLKKTLEYAGIALGCVVVLAITFALVRWRRRKSRSTMPAFDQMDYGMNSRRRSEPRSSLGTAAALGGRASEGGYPFSNRPRVGPSAPPLADDQDEYYDDQYYQDPNHAYGGQNMHPMTGMAGGASLKDPYYTGHDHQYDPNSYDQNGYAYDQQYYKETYGDYDQQQGYDPQQYDQHGNYIGDHTAAAGDGGFYDPAAYGDYSEQQTGHQDQKVPDAHHGGAAINEYGAEDFGGSGHGSQLAQGGATPAGAGGAHGGYGHQY